jgi:hypothetical protein
MSATPREQLGTISQLPGARAREAHEDLRDSARRKMGA